jgi:hypothetical protein
MGGGGKLTTKEDKKVRKITLEECAKHRTPDDAWMHMRGKVYDVSNWEDHPGKDVHGMSLLGLLITGFCVYFGSFSQVNLH